MANESRASGTRLGIARDLSSTLLAACAVSLAVLPLLGQPTFGSVESVETMVATAASVVIGRVSRIEVTYDERRRGFPAEVTVDETLKGDRAQRVAVAIEARDTILARWRDTRARLLVAVPRDAATPVVAIDLDDPGLAVLTADLAVLKSPATVIQAVRDEIARAPGGAATSQGVFIRVPPGLIAGTTLAKYYTNMLVAVPIDARLERRALAILRGEQEGLRSEAVGCLRYFKSDANIRLLTDLLTDTTLSTLQMAQGSMGHEIVIYDVRRAAYEILRSWGLAPTEPVLRVETYRPELVTLVVLSDKSITAAELKELLAFPNLQILVLTNAQLPVGAGKQIAAIRTLRELNLAGSNVTDADLRLLTGLTRLEALELMTTGITDVGLKAVAELSALKTVGLAHTRVTAQGLAELRQRRPNLTIDR